MTTDVRITKGSRIRYLAEGGAELSGTVYHIDRRKGTTEFGRVRYYSVYFVAEAEGEIARDAIIEAKSATQLKKDILLALLDQDVLDNIETSRSAVTQSCNKYGLNPSKRYLGHQPSAAAALT